MRVVLFFVLMGGLFWLLAQQNPGVLDSTDGKMEFGQRALWFMLIAGSALAARRLPLGQTAKYMAIWGAVLAALVLGYSYRDAWMESQLVAELAPSRPRHLSDGSLQLRAGEGGHFHANGRVNGITARFLLDTGATEIVLSPGDARRAGYAVDRMEYDRSSSTANGIGGGARIRIDTLDVGGMVLHDVPAIVNQAEMDESLLGMTFLTQFHSYRVEGNTLTLKP